MSEPYTPESPLHDVELPWEVMDRATVLRDVIASDMATAFSEAPLTMADDVKRHALKLATLRHELAMRDDAVKAARRGFEDTIAEQLRNLEALKREIEVTEGTVRALALVVHQTEGHTKPCPGVSVVVGKEYEVDEAAALTWAKTTRMCLVPEAVDLKAIKKMAAVTELPFVTVTEKPSVRIATDLLKALDGAA